MKQTNPPSPLEIILMDYIQPLLPVTEETAKQLALYFGTSAELWVNLQNNFIEGKLETVYPITIDGKLFIIKDQFLRGKKIKRLAGISKEKEIFSNSRGNVKPCWRAYLKVYGIEPDKEIGDNEFVDLKQPARKVFYTCSVCTYPV